MKRINRKNKIRYSTILLVVCLLTLLCSCGTQKETTQPAGGEPSANGTTDTNDATAESGKTPQDRSGRVQFLAVGDNIIHADILADAKKRADDGGYAFAPMYADVADKITSADIAYVNQEGPVAKSYNVSGYPNFNAPEEIGHTLSDLGFDVINLANNHMTDMGAKGLDETISYFSALNGVTEIGGYRQDDYDNVRVVEKNGVKIALLSYTTFTNSNSGATLSNGCVIPYAKTETIDRQVARAKDAADFVIVSMHWGTENIIKPDEEQVYWANYLATKNVDVVLGMHSHTLMPITKLDGTDGHQTLVAYSLGNFFGGMLDTLNQVGGMLTFDLVKNDGKTAVENIAFTPTAIYWEGTYSSSTNNRTSFGVYLSDHYTEQMASKSGTGLTTAKVKNAYTAVIDAAYLK